MAHNETLLINGVETQVRMFDHSAQEIDAAVGRAVSGGALDTSVENVSKELGTFVRPNLLDNWYFGRPVDQRGGYVAIPGASYYVSGNAEGTPAGTLRAYASVSKYNEGWYNYILNSTTYWIPAGYIVRGYTGNVYSIDRWKLYQSTVSVTVRDDGLGIKRSSGDFYTIVQYVDNSQDLAGKTVTFSALITSAPGAYRLRILAGRGTTTTIANVIGNAGETGIKSVTATLPDNVSDLWVSIYTATTAEEYVVAAIKLEMGDTQTLAHQDSAGNWVLNEVPDYGEQLRRCQRYFRRLQYGYGSDVIGAGFANADNSGRVVLALDVAMRTVPSITHAPTVSAISGGTAYNATINSVRANTNTSDATLELSIPDITTRAVFVLTTVENNAYIDLSADL